MKRYYTPVPAISGSLHQQPWANQVVSGWCLDVALNYCRPEFLDAPDFIPSGSVSAMDTDSLTFGIANTRRP